MSLSQKTLELDTIIVETLFNRGVPLSTSQTYMPIVSYVGDYIPPPTYTVEEQVLVVTTTLVANVTTLAGGSDVPCLAVDALGNIYVSNISNNLIRKITPAGVVTTLAGSSVGYANGTGTSATFNFPMGVAVDALGNIYVADILNNSIRKITPAGVVTTLASAVFNRPKGVAVDALGNVYVADTSNNVIRKITPAGVVTTLAGGGSVGGTASGHDNSTGTTATFNSPIGVAVDALGNVYVADTSNNLIRKITPAGVVTTLAGGGSVEGTAPGHADGTGTSATFNSPRGVAVDALGNIYVVDNSNNLIRKITPAGVVTTLAGGGSVGYADGTGTRATFNLPIGVAVDALGNVYVADSGNNLIRKIDTKYPIYSSNYQTVPVNCNITVSQDPICPCCPWSAPIRGNMLTWSYLPVSTIYDSYFHGINLLNLVDNLTYYQEEEAAAVISLQLCLDTIVTLSNTTLNTFVTMCNMNSSTISSYTSFLRHDTAISIQHYNTINNIYTNTSSITGNLMSTFFTVTFPSKTTTLLEIGNYYSLQRPITLPVPVPWYWQGNPSRYIGPGLSSMYTSSLCNAPLMASYWATLSNTSTAWSASNTIIQTSIQSYYNYTTHLINSIDTGSSLSSVFYNSNSSFMSHLCTIFYGNDVSTISSFVL